MAETTTTQTTSIDADYKSRLLENIDFANAIAQMPYQTYGGQRVAGFSPQELEAYDMLRASLGMGMPNYQAAIGATERLQNFTPEQIQAANTGPVALATAASLNRGDVRDVTAGSFLAGNLAGYMNPYLSNVLDASMSDLNRARQMAELGTARDVTRARAFGNSRRDLLTAENNRNFLDAAARTSAGLRAEGFNQAGNLMGQDHNRALQAGLSNQGMDWQSILANAGFAQQTGLANAAARNQMGQYNAQLAQQAALANQQAGIAGANINMQAANLGGNLAGQMRGASMQDIQALANAGGMVRNMNQANLDTAYGDFEAQRDYPLRQLGIMQSALGQNPWGSSQQTTQPLFQNNAANLMGYGIGAAGLLSAAPAIGQGLSTLGNWGSGAWNWLSGLGG